MDQIFYNGTILPMTEETATAEAMLCRDGYIAALGSMEEILALQEGKEAEKVDLEGHVLLPGFIDGHSHLTAAAYQMTLADVSAPPSGSCASVEEVCDRLRQFLKENPPKTGGWLLGMGYDASAYPEGKGPTRWDLDQVSTEIPIAVTHASGHLCVVNSLGLQRLGYLEEHPEIPAGGEVTQEGELKEQAFLAPPKQAILRGSAPLSMTELIHKAAYMYASYGITTVQDAKVSETEYGMLQEAGNLPVDVVLYMVPELARECLPKQLPAQNPYHGSLRKAGEKLFLDGSPQGKTAWLSQPYFKVPEGEDPSYRGMGMMTDEELIHCMAEAEQCSWQLNIHANGDEAIEQLIRCYEKAGGSGKNRPVVIHAQTVREDQLARMESLGILCSFFLDHVYYWGDYHRDSVLGLERAERISPLRSALRHHISFTLHQDTPVVPPNPILALHNAVNRRTASGKLLGAEECITPYEALRALTVNGAYQIFEENRKGMLKPGYLADLVILDKNPLAISPDRLSSIRVLQTIKEGKTIYTI